MDKITLDKTFKHIEEGDYFTFDIESKITVLLGPNGAGKTTMLKSFEEQLKRNHDILFDNPQEIDGNVGFSFVQTPEHLVQRFQSEGERMSYTLSHFVTRIGQSVNGTLNETDMFGQPLEKKKGKPVVLFDRLDSGLSYDRIKDMTDVITQHIAHDVLFVAVAANSYELCYLLKDHARFYWIPTNEWIELPSFEEFIEMYKREG